MDFDFTKLRWRIVERFRTQEDFAYAAELPPEYLAALLNNRLPFSTTDIVKASNLLDIPGKEIDTYFFTPKVR